MGDVVRMFRVPGPCRGKWNCRAGASGPPSGRPEAKLAFRATQKKRGSEANQGEQIHHGLGGDESLGSSGLDVQVREPRRRKLGTKVEEKTE